MPLFLSANNIEIIAKQTNRKHMEWLKIFGSEEAARTVIKENIPQLVIAKNKRICLALHQGVFYAVQDLSLIHI